MIDMYYDRGNKGYKKECKRIYDKLKEDLSDVKNNVSLCDDYHLAIHHINDMEERINDMENKIKQYEKLFEDFRSAMYGQI